MREDEEKAIRIIQAEQEIVIAKLVIKIEELQEILLRYVRGHQTAIDGIYCSQLMKEKA